LQCPMNDTAVGGAQCVHGHGLALTLRFFPQPQRHVFEGFPPALAVAFDIDEDMGAFAPRSFAGNAGH
jgi:hypothetical protein